MYIICRNNTNLYLADLDIKYRWTGDIKEAVRFKTENEALKYLYKYKNRSIFDEVHIDNLEEIKEKKEI
jgi:hypothetical protein